MVRDELAAYSNALAEKPQVVALSKIDALDEETRAERLADLASASRQRPLMLSAASGEGVELVLRALRDVIDSSRRAEDEAAPRPAWTP